MSEEFTAIDGTSAPPYHTQTQDNLVRGGGRTVRARDQIGSEQNGVWT